MTVNEKGSPLSAEQGTEDKHGAEKTHSSSQHKIANSIARNLTLRGSTGVDFVSSLLERKSLFFSDLATEQGPLSSLDKV